MTYVELFDKTHTANVCAMLTNPPDRVIIIGEKYKNLEKHADRYREVIHARGAETEIIPMSVNKNNISAITELLCSLVEKYGDVHLDLTGGEDLFLCAAGIVYERYKREGVHVNMHRFNIRSNRVIDCDLDGVTVMDNSLPEISVEENIRIWGGLVIGKPDSSELLDSDAEQDIRDMWDICRRDVKAWNRQINVLNAAESRRSIKSTHLLTEAPVSRMTSFLSDEDRDHIVDDDILYLLYEKGLVRTYRIDGGSFEVKYKNPLVKRCLTKAGQVLELMILLCAKNARDVNGAPTYNDAKSGVRIDWDGDVEPKKGKYDTENELDVMLMHGALPVFISCKNGSFDTEELYKLNSVADRFGREYAKKIIVATALDSLGGLGRYIRQRAADMDIRIIDDAQDMTETELTELIKSLWM